MLKGMLKGALRLAAGILRLQFVDFKWDMKTVGEEIKKSMEDGYLEDEELANVLDCWADQINVKQLRLK